MGHNSLVRRRKLAKRMQRTGLLVSFVSLLICACAQKPALCQTLAHALTLETAAERKTTLQAELKELEQLGLSEEELAEARGQLDRLLSALAAFEEATQRRGTYRGRLASLPERLEEAITTRRLLEKRPPSAFPDVTESLRAEYDARRQAFEAELNDLTAQAVSGGVRLARLPEEIREHKTSLERLELERQESDLTAVQEGSWESGSELLDVQIQGHRNNLEALQAERQWLIQRGPLHDALIHVVRLRLEHVQDDLHTIQTSLDKTLREQQTTSSQRVSQLQEALDASTSPATRIHLQARLETARAQQRTADYQRQLTGLRKEVQDQETLNNQVRQDTNRLVSLADQYTSGERIAQRLLIKFERLRRERGRITENLIETFPSHFSLLPAEKSANPLDVLRIRLRGLNDALFAVDDQLYEFNGLVNHQVNQLTAVLFSASPNELAGALSSLRADLEAQRTALREQQLVLADLTQTLARLIALDQEHKRLLDDGYRLALNRMLWLKNRPTLTWALVGDMTAHGLPLVSGIVAAVRSDLSNLWLRLKQRAALWGFLALLLVVLPLAARRIWSHLDRMIQGSLAASMQQQEPPRARAVLLIGLQSVVWPVYLSSLGWSRQLFISHSGGDAAMTAAIVSGVYVGAFVLVLGFFSQALFRPGGWGQQFWQLDDAGCRLLRRTFGIGCLGGLLLLVPRHVILTTSSDPLLVDGSQTLERLLLLAFQGIVLVLALRMGWPSGPLMAPVLARSRDQDGMLWRVWPFILIILLTALGGVIILDILGYRYTARFIWLHGLETLSIVLASRLVLLFLLVYGAQRLVRALFDPGRRWYDPARRQAAERSLAVFRYFAQIVLSVVALLLIVELWGFSVWSMLSSQVGSQIMTRAFIVLLTIGIALMVIQGSNVLTEYILRPRLNAEGEAQELGRKLRTLTPLVQTILKVVVALIAVLVLLEQVNIRTGPLLAGLGLFGLAVGLASQSLIKDIINGLFILFEDSLSVGDIVTVRGIGGVVEKITLRVVVLRDLQGNVHVIPNSTIDLVTNRTKIFSRYLLDVGVAYREDVDTVINILKELDEDMRQDMGYGYNMLEPIEILGLDRFGDSAVYVRARLKTRPGKQWEVGREFNRRMKKTFDERGIEIPFPHRTLYWGKPKEDSQLPVRQSGEAPGVQAPPEAVPSPAERPTSHLRAPGDQV